MADNFFRDVGAGIFKPVGDFVSGAVTALQPGRVQQMQLQQQKMRQFAESQRIQNLLRQAQTDALRQRGTATDPLVQGAVDIGKIQTAKEKFRYKDKDDNVVSSMTPETAAFFEAAEKAVKDRSGFKEPDINLKTGKPRQIFSPSGKVVGTRNKDGSVTYSQGQDNRGLFSGGVSLFEAPEQKAPVKKTEEAPTARLEDFFRSDSETLGQGNVPQTFEQIGITNADDQQTFQEMQKAVPDVDLRQEFKDEPERMQALLKLWRKKKLSKQKLREAFSMIQQKARESLGIA